MGVAFLPNPLPLGEGIKQLASGNLGFSLSLRERAGVKVRALLYPRAIQRQKRPAEWRAFFFEMLLINDAVYFVPMPSAFSVLAALAPSWPAFTFLSIFRILPALPM